MILDPYVIKIILLLLAAESVITFKEYESMIVRFDAFPPFTRLSTIYQELLKEVKSEQAKGQTDEQN